MNQIYPYSFSPLLFGIVQQSASSSKTDNHSTLTLCKTDFMKNIRNNFMKLYLQVVLLFSDII